MSDERAIEGKTPWEFVCGWYQFEEIKHSIAIKLSGPERDRDFPTDVSSDAFAAWLTEQYRFAMNKGIEIAFREREQSRAAVEAWEALEQLLADKQIDCVIFGSEGNAPGCHCEVISTQEEKNRFKCAPTAQSAVAAARNQQAKE